MSAHSETSAHKGVNYRIDKRVGHRQPMEEEEAADVRIIAYRTVKHIRPVHEQ